MKYTLMRCYFKHRGSTFDTLVFDLWNNEFNTGYEINVTLYKMGDLITELEKYVKAIINQTYDISKWDLIIRNIKQKKLYSWRVY